MEKSKELEAERVKGETIVFQVNLFLTRISKFAFNFNEEINVELLFRVRIFFSIQYFKESKRCTVKTFRNINLI